MSDVKIEDHSSQYMSAVDRALDSALDAVGLFVASEAADELENSPRRVDTGRLKGSITRQVEMSEKAVYVGTNVEYALYVHEGTSRMEPNRYLRNAVDRNRDQITEYIKKAMS